MEKIIKINELYSNELNILERAYLETTARENILNYMILNNQKDTERYQEFWNEYILYLKAYNDIKNEFVLNCINSIVGHPFRGNWTVDFDKKEVILNEG
jgi:hypothetical protein